MNVTDRGYYTTTYLDNYNKLKQHRHSNRRNPARPDRDLNRKISESSLTNQKDKLGASMMTPSATSPSIMNKTVTTGPQSNYQNSPETQYTASTQNDTMDTHEIALDPDHLNEEITPAQLNILQKRYQKKPHKSRRRRSYYDDEDDVNSGRNDYDSQFDDGSSFDGASSNNRSSVYDNYYNREHNLRVPRKSDHPKSRSRNQPPKRHGDDYYIQQKKRYDDAEFYKPKNYTHKTFKDVFNDGDEVSGRYNPMEFVFDDPEKIKEQEQNQKLKTAFKNFQVKLGRDDYDNYNYYDHKDSKSNAANEIFVQGGGESDDDSDYGGGETQEFVDLDENGQPIVGVSGESDNKKPPKKKVNFKKMWKSKTKQFKKDLGKDFYKNMEKQWEFEDEKKKRKEIELLEKEQQRENETFDDSYIDGEVTNEPIIAEPDDEASKKFYAGPNPNFHPMWNYLLSWVAYEQPKTTSRNLTQNHYNQGPVPIAESIGQTTSPASVPQIVPPSESRSLVKQTPTGKKNKKNNVPRIKMTRDQLKNFNKNVSKVKNMWNLPASNLFANNMAREYQAERGIDDLDGMPTINQSLPQSSMYEMSPFDGNSQEFVIEVDDEDDADYDEELYFNPNTGQLEREPPTSYSSMDPKDRSFGSSVPGSPQSRFTANRSLIDTSNGAKTIISNINQLIKSVKIMKIIFAPIDIIGESFPTLQTFVILIELGIFMWILYELSLLIDALCMMVKAICAPMIAMGRFMNRIV